MSIDRRRRSGVVVCVWFSLLLQWMMVIFFGDGDSVGTSVGGSADGQMFLDNENIQISSGHVFLVLFHRLIRIKIRMTVIRFNRLKASRVGIVFPNCVPVDPQIVWIQKAFQDFEWDNNDQQPYMLPLHIGSALRNTKIYDYNRETPYILFHPRPRSTLPNLCFLPIAFSNNQATRHHRRKAAEKIHQTVSKHPHRNPGPIVNFMIRISNRGRMGTRLQH